MGFSAICFSYKYLLIRNISGKSGKKYSSPFSTNKLSCYPFLSGIQQNTGSAQKLFLPAHWGQQSSDVLMNLLQVFGTIHVLRWHNDWPFWRDKKAELDIQVKYRYRAPRIKTSSLLRPVFASPKWYFSYDIRFDIKITSLWRPGPGCSKLTTSLVNVSLKFQTLISQICQYFLLKKMWEAFAVQKLGDNLSVQAHEPCSISHLVKLRVASTTTLCYGERCGRVVV